MLRPGKFIIDCNPKAFGRGHMPNGVLTPLQMFQRTYEAWTVDAWTVDVSGKKKMRIRKYPDTCGQGLTRVEVWENEKCCRNTRRRRVFPQLFRVLPRSIFNQSTRVLSKVCFLISNIEHSTDEIIPST